MLGKKRVRAFQKKVYDFYKKHKRDFTWRNTRDPYKILVSEIMLQQTQTSRVKEKYKEFIRVFPTFKKLGEAPQKEVLRTWQGLGYNRRARSLHQTAQKVIKEYKGRLPNDPEVLKTFPGIGPATASSICAFAFNKPTVFIETNIRSVFIYEFFKRNIQVHDKDILPLIEETLDTHNPREWYFALMDYGVMLKQKYKNPSKKSVHYTKQAPFKTSNRRVRGLLIKELLKGTLDEDKFMKEFKVTKKVLTKNLEDLKKESFLKKRKGKYVLA